MANQNQDQAAQGAGPATSVFPLNRVVAFLGPYIAIVSGVLSTWLIQHFPGLHVDRATLGASVTKAIVFAVGAGVTFALHHKWLDGWQQWQTGLNQLTIAQTVQSPVGGSPGVGSPGVGSDANASVTSQVLAAAANGGAGAGTALIYQPPETAITPDPPLADGEPTDPKEG
jgi:hypothetical protein